MKRRNFFKSVAIAGTAAVVAPAVLCEPCEEYIFGHVSGMNVFIDYDKVPVMVNGKLIGNVSMRLLF